ncbi:hypothetical protein pipiens_002131 [Culex pipiens pipiens]|uniref:Chemosensory protein n=1 Tax=Culex pipiens pipiens TaxID=38569 RepID=A0ABD1DM02_CULPP
MKLLIAFALVALVAAQDSTYTNKYDHIDVDEILKSDRLFKNYYNCLIDRGPCTPDVQDAELKHKETGYKVISSLIENRPAEWAVLQDKYDPERKFVEKYREEAAAAGIKL